MARRIGGPDFLVVTPGVRPDWAGADDQARAATPAQTLTNGASHIVCGRPITAASDPRAAALRIVAEMAGFRGAAITPHLPTRYASGPLPLPAGEVNEAANPAISTGPRNTSPIGRGRGPRQRRGG